MNSSSKHRIVHIAVIITYIFGAATTAITTTLGGVLFAKAVNASGQAQKRKSD